MASTNLLLDGGKDGDPAEMKHLKKRSVVKKSKFLI